MIADILTVIWKERKGLLLIGGSKSRTFLILLTPVAFFGIVFPLIQKEEWFATAFSLVLSIIVPFTLVSMVIGESFAGERERHTLQTLLASRLPDRAILFGKLGSAIAYGWGMTLCVLALSAISANIAIGDGQVHFYPPILVLANVIISLLVAVLVGLMGVLVSLRARTVQEAQQMLFAAILIPGLVIQVLPILLTSLMPNGKDVIRQILEADFNHVIAVIIGFCSVVSLGLFLIVLARFQRARLTL